MERDERLRALLDAAVPAETGRAEARSDIARRVRAFRRRRRAIRATGAVAAGAAVLSGVLLAGDLGGTTRLPVIGGGPAEVSVTTACGDHTVDREVGEYLDDWTSGSHTPQEACILRSVAGPEPTFDTDGLGPEQVWIDDDLSRGGVEPQDDARSQGYPVVHIGTTAVADDPNLRVRVLRSWTDRSPDGSVWWCASTAISRTCGPPVDGDAGVATGSIGSTITVLVPADTAVAALTIDGEPAAWQRPRGRTVLFSPATGGRRITVTVYDASGTVTAEYPLDVDL